LVCNNAFKLFEIRTPGKLISSKSNKCKQNQNI